MIRIRTSMRSPGKKSGFRKGGNHFFSCLITHLSLPAGEAEQMQVYPEMRSSSSGRLLHTRNAYPECLS